MYIRAVHAELDQPTLHAFIRAHPLGLFTTAIPHPTIPTLQTSHVPFVLSTPPPNTDGRVYLRGHLARANPQAKALLSALPSSSSSSSSETDTLPSEVLVLFNAPVHSYVTPKFYVATKPATGKVVPTWDYAACQVYGTLRVHHRDTPATSAFLQAQMEELASAGEPQFAPDGGEQWKVRDAPERFIELLKRAVIGLEIEVRTCEGRFKLGQENTDGDWRGVVEGFRRLGTREGDIMAEMIVERGKHREAARQESLTRSND